MESVGESSAVPLFPERHPRAVTALVLGIISVFSGFFGPFAWVVGARAVREIDAQPDVYSGRDLAQTGRVLGIFGTVVLASAAAVVIGTLVYVIAIVGGGVYSAIR